jgi:hypothetical protein
VAAPRCPSATAAAECLVQQAGTDPSGQRCRTFHDREDPVPALPLLLTGRWLAGEQRSCADGAHTAARSSGPRAGPPGGRVPCDRPPGRPTVRVGRSFPLPVRSVHREILLHQAHFHVQVVSENLQTGSQTGQGELSGRYPREPEGVAWGIESCRSSCTDGRCGGNPHAPPRPARRDYAVRTCDPRGRAPEEGALTSIDAHCRQGPRCRGHLSRLAPLCMFGAYLRRYPGLGCPNSLLYTLNEPERPRISRIAPGDGPSPGEMLRQIRR